MTDTTTHELSRPAPPQRRWRRRAWIAFAAAVVLLIAAAIAVPVTLVHLDRQYGPLEPGSFGGVYSQRGFDHTSGLTSQLSSARGATGLVLSSMNDAGAHSVRIDSIETSAVDKRIQWSAYHLAAGGSVAGRAIAWRDFPATVPAHGTIRLLITITRPPRCRQGAPRGVSVLYDGSLTVRWQSLLHTHTTTLDYLGSVPSIRIC